VNIAQLEALLRTFKKELVKKGVPYAHRARVDDMLTLIHNFGGTK
jgi:hypothetical protein